MAARIRKTHQDEVRAKIQASQLINRLQDYALGKSKSELSTAQIKSIEILLSKSLPNLQSTELSGGTDNTLTIKIVE